MSESAAATAEKPQPPAALEEIPRMAPPPSRKKAQGPPPAVLAAPARPAPAVARPPPVPDQMQIQERFRAIAEAAQGTGTIKGPLPSFCFSPSIVAAPPSPAPQRQKAAEAFGPEDVALGVAVGVALGISAFLLYRWAFASSPPAPAAAAETLVKVVKRGAKGG